MPSFEVSHHTKIIEFLIQNSAVLSVRRKRFELIDGKQSVARLLEEARTLQPSDALADILSFHAVEMAKFEKAYAETPMVFADIEPGFRAFVRVKASSRTAADYVKALKAEAAKAKGPLKITLQTAAEMFADGADTIYNPGWVAMQAATPQQMISDWGNLVTTTSKAYEKAVNIATKAADGDLVGAIVGGISGAIGGAINGARGGGGAKGAEEGAAEGAISGAIEGGISGSAGAAVGGAA